MESWPGGNLRPSGTIPVVLLPIAIGTAEASAADFTPGARADSKNSTRDLLNPLGDPYAVKRSQF